MPEKWKGVVLAQRGKGNRTIDYLTDLAVGAAFTLGRERRDQLGVALVSLGRIEHRAQIAIWGSLGPGSIERHAQGLQDLAHVALKTLPVGLADATRADALPVATFDVVVAQIADRWFRVPSA